MSESVERPLASEETERRVVETFPIDMAPEEFAARDGYGWLDFPFARFRYRDPALDRWIQQVNEILREPEKLRECQSKYHTAAELQLIHKNQEDKDEQQDEDRASPIK